MKQLLVLMIFQKNCFKLLDEKALEILMELCVDIYAVCFKKNLQLHHSKKGSPAW